MICFRQTLLRPSWILVSSCIFLKKILRNLEISDCIVILFLNIIVEFTFYRSFFDFYYITRVTTSASLKDSLSFHSHNMRYFVFIFQCNCMRFENEKINKIENKPNIPAANIRMRHYRPRIKPRRKLLVRILNRTRNLPHTHSQSRSDKLSH